MQEARRGPPRARPFLPRAGDFSTKSSSPTLAGIVLLVVRLDAPMPARLGPVGAEPRPREQPGWLDEFHAGDPAVMRQCYVEHFAAVDRAVGRILQGADKETVVHEVFY